MFVDDGQCSYGSDLSGQGHGGVGASAFAALKRPYLDEKYILTDSDVINSTTAEISDLKANLNEITRSPACPLICFGF